MNGITIFGGVAQNRRIHKVPKRVRPTPVRLRRAFFEILGDIEELYFIDLFAGSGVMGIEALSRGVESTTFIDISHTSCKAIEQNIRSVNLVDTNYNIICEDAIRWLDWFSPNDGTIVFASPPYIENYLPKILHAFEDFAELMVENVMVILQFPKRSLPEEFRIKPQRIHKVGDDTLIFWYLDEE